MWTGLRISKVWQLICWVVLVGFYGISTTVGYSMVNPLYTYIYIYIKCTWFGLVRLDGISTVPRVMKTKFPALVMVFGVVSSEGHIMPPHIFEVGLKVNTKVYLDVLKSVVIRWCNQVAGGRPWVWQQDSGAGPQVQRDPGLASEGGLRLCTLLSLPPPSPTWNRWTTSFGHSSRTSPTWPPTKPKPARSPPSAEYSPSSRWRLWIKEGSQFLIRFKAVIEAEGGYIELMSALLHNQVTWIDFFQ